MKYNSGNKFNLTKNKAPLPFKLDLIAEVKKESIIWSNFREKKNNDLLIAAWQRITKALSVPKVYSAEYCQHYWMLLVSQYRNYLNQGRSMDPRLVGKMKFMRRQLKKLNRRDGDDDDIADDVESEDEDEDDGAEEEEIPQQAPQQAPQPKKAKRQNVSEVNHALGTSVEVLKFLFKQLTPEHVLPVKKSLIEVMFKVMPDLQVKISKHATQHAVRYGSVSNVDWSGLGVPDKICKIIWDHKVAETMTIDLTGN